MKVIHAREAREEQSRAMPLRSLILSNNTLTADLNAPKRTVRLKSV
jgi:hypothetical protein